MSKKSTSYLFLHMFQLTEFLKAPYVFTLKDALPVHPFHSRTGSVRCGRQGRCSGCAVAANFKIHNSCSNSSSLTEAHCTKWQLHQILCQTCVDSLLYTTPRALSFLPSKNYSYFIHCVPNVYTKCVPRKFNFIWNKTTSITKYLKHCTSTYVRVWIKCLFYQAFV